MISRLAPIVLLLSVAGCRRAPDLEAERGAVRALFDHMATSLCAGDWPAYQDTWANDSTVERLDAASGSWLTGWAPISALYQSMMPQLRGCRFKLTKMRIHVSQDATMAWAVSEGTVHMADTNIAPATLWGAFGFEKRAGKWRMVLDHSAVRVATDTTRRQ